MRAGAREAASEAMDRYAAAFDGTAFVEHCETLAPRLLGFFHRLSGQRRIR